MREKNKMRLNSKEDAVFRVVSRDFHCFKYTFVTSLKAALWFVFV